MRKHSLVNIFLISSISFFSCQSLAITNIEKERTAKSEEGWNGHVRLKFNGKSGNNDETDLGIGSHIRWNNETIKWLNWYSRDYQRNNGITSNDQTFFHTRVIHNHQQVIATEYFLQYEQAPFSGIKRRALEGLGIRFRSWFKPQTDQKLSSGESYQGIGVFNEQVREVDLGSTQVEQRFRGNLYSHWLYQHSGERAASTSVTVYIQPDLANVHDVKALLQAQVSLPINEQLHLQWKLQSNWDSLPPSGVTREVHETNVQLKYSF
jgi:putative salt-induced outer membrane protein YdiY